MYTMSIFCLFVYASFFPKRTFFIYISWRHLIGGSKNWHTVCFHQLLNWYEARSKCRSTGKFLQAYAPSRNLCDNNRDVDLNDTWHNRLIVERIIWETGNQFWLRRVWRYQRGNQNPYIEKEMANKKSTKEQTRINFILIFVKYSFIYT